ncbi:hypothetical protein LTR95_009229 [Oleoguttula sp. CCFEE 5521]
MEQFKLTNVDRRLEVRHYEQLEILLRIPKTPRSFTFGGGSASRQLILEIITYFMDPESVVHLAITSASFSHLLQSSFRQAVIRLTAPWAGERILRIGHEATSVPLICPEFTAQHYDDDAQLDRAGKAAAQKAQKPLWYIVRRERNCPAPACCVPRESPLELLQQILSDDPFGRYALMLDSLTLPPGHRRNDILRNLDMKQYVRARTLAPSRRIDMWGRAKEVHYSLEQFVEMHTTWTDGADNAHPGLKRKGRWAGCRFDIVDKADFQCRRGWVDVSSKIAGWWDNGGSSSTSTKKTSVETAMISKSSYASRVFASSIDTLIILPPELLNAIATLLNHEAGICLVLTSAYFCRLLLPLFRNAILNLTSAWANDPIVHIGDYAETIPPTCPEFVFRPYEWHPELSQAEQEAGEVAANALDHLVPAWRPDGVCWGPPKSPLRRRCTSPRRRTMSFVRDSSSSLLPASEPPNDVLRNLNLKEYVRLDELPQLSDIEDVGRLFETYTTWTDAHQRVHDRVGCNGPWAGCRLDIVDAAEFEEREGWKDVTVEVLDLEMGQSQ